MLKSATDFRGRRLQIEDRKGDSNIEIALNPPRISDIGLLIYTPCQFSMGYKCIYVLSEKERDGQIG